MLSLLLRILGFTIWIVHILTDLTGITRTMSRSSSLSRVLQAYGWDSDTAQYFALWVNQYTIIATLCLIIGFATKPNKTNKAPSAPSDEQQKEDKVQNMNPENET